MAELSGIGAGRIERIEGGAELRVEEIDPVVTAFGITYEKFRSLWRARFREEEQLEAGEETSSIDRYTSVPNEIDVAEPAGGGTYVSQAAGPQDSRSERPLLDLDLLFRWAVRVRVNERFVIRHGERDLVCELVGVRDPRKKDHRIE